MEISGGNPTGPARLGEAGLERIATMLADLYLVLYEERPVDPRASLTDNLLAFVFEGGLSVADEWLLQTQRDERLREFRRHFFEVVSDEMVGVVSGLTGLPVTYSFCGFDPKTRTTHAIFVLDLTTLPGDEHRAEVTDRGERARRGARRLDDENVATRGGLQASLPVAGQAGLAGLTQWARLCRPSRRKRWAAWDPGSEEAPPPSSRLRRIPNRSRKPIAPTMNRRIAIRGETKKVIATTMRSSRAKIMP